MLPYQLTYSTKYILKHLFSDRIQVNDQIIEVDGVSLVGVTQIFAAQTLKNTSGLVRYEGCEIFPSKEWKLLSL